MTIAEYGALDGLGLAALVRRREVSPAELLDTAIARLERVNPRINAVVTLLYDEARRVVAAPPPASPPPFYGVPFLLKDLHAALAGTPAIAGSRYLQGNRSDATSTLVDRYRAAGLVIFGKTNVPELGIAPYTEPDLFGPARNPWDLARTPGGSSGGSAAAVAARVVPMAHGNDGAGSIRLPAGCCGLFGLKPTRGRTPTGPEQGEIWNGWVINHAITVSVRDSAALLDATAGPEAVSPYHPPAAPRPFLDEAGARPGRLRIAFSKRPPMSARDVHPDCAAAVDDAARLLLDLGHEVEEATPDLAASPEALTWDFFRVVCVETAAEVAHIARALGRRPGRRDLEINTWLTVVIGRQQTAVGIALARERLAAACRRLTAFFDRYDVLLTPTTGAPAVPIGALVPKGVEALGQRAVLAAGLGFLLRVPALVAPSAQRVFDFMSFTPLANVSGQPSMNVPLHWNAGGLPVGTMFTGRFGAEATLLRLAAELEAARPWAGRRPPVNADA